MGNIESKKKLHQFKRDRKDARDVLRIKLFIEAQKIKYLDKHVEEFLKLIKKDVKKHNIQDLKKHAHEFEKEVHDELTYLMNMTHDDLKLYLKVLKSLQKFKIEMKRFSKEDKEFKRYGKAELRYAQVIAKAAHQRIDSLHRLFRRLEKS